MIKKVILIIFSSYIGMVNASVSRTDTGFYYPIGEENFDTACGPWLGRDPGHGGCYTSGRYHIGTDMMTNDLNANVYAISDGNVFHKHCDNASWGPGNCALFIEHTTSDDQIFTGLYGHLRTSISSGDDVRAGDIIGTTGPWDGGIHLHFGVRIGKSITPSPWGRLPNSSWPSTHGFVDSMKFLDSHYPKIIPSTICGQASCDVGSQTFSNGDMVGWWPKADCSNATHWFGMTEINGVYEPTHSLQLGDVCICR